MIKKEYIEFVELKKITKTRRFMITSKKNSEELLGVIKWHPNWRQYCFFPLPETMWSDGCLEEIKNFLEKIKPKKR